jgi:hypothetical protein
MIGLVSEGWQTRVGVWAAPTPAANWKRLVSNASETKGERNIGHLSFILANRRSKVCWL